MKQIKITESKMDEALAQIDTLREHFLSMSSSGKNEANQGIKGILGAVLDALSYEEEPGTLNAALSHIPGGGNACMWTLSRYIQSAPQDTNRSEWDEIEKSIIAKFANDVSIGVRSGKLEMTVTKTF